MSMITAANSEAKNSSSMTSSSLNSFARSREHGMSVFHFELPPGAYIQTDECPMAVQQCIQALNGWCEAGTRTTTVFLKVLKGTMYEPVAGQLQGAMMQVQELAGMEMTKLQRNFQNNWCHLSRFSGASNLQTDSSKDHQIVAKELMNFVGSFCQLFLNIAQHLGQFLNTGTPASEGLLAVPFVQNPVQLPVGSRPGVLAGSRSKVIGGSPAGLRKQVTSFLSKIGQKPPDTSCFYVPLDAEVTKSSVTPGVLTSQQSSQSASSDGSQGHGKANGHVATQEDLDLVISMLSQRSRVPPTGMQAIPEYPVAGPLDGLRKPAAAGSQPMTAAGPGLSLAGQISVPGLIASGKPVGPELTKGQMPNPTVVVASNQSQSSKSEALAAEGLTKMNTWPFKMNQKPMWPGGGDLRMMHSFFGIGDYESLAKLGAGVQPHQLGVWPAKENDDHASATFNHVPSWYGGLWPNVNNCDMSGGFWPSQHSTWNTDCLNSLSNSVSTVVESSSGSEESSSGDQQWSSGGQVPRRRRHSSGEHSLLSQHATLSNPLPGMNAAEHGITDDKFGWTGQFQVMGQMATVDDESVPPGHRALSVQWSDPLMNRTLSCWDSVTKSPSSSTTNGGYFVKPATSGSHLDKSF